MATYTVTTTDDTVDAADGQLSLREALALADADMDTFTADRIEFASNVQGGRIVLGGEQLSVHSEVVIDGGTGVTLDANRASRVLLVQSPYSGGFADVTLTSLTITGGYTSGGNESGGGIYAARTVQFGISRPQLTLTNTTVSGNATAGTDAAGGGIAAGSVTLIGSTVSDNRTTGDGADGGGISSDLSGVLGSPGGGVVTLTNSTVSGNTTTGRDADGGGVAAFGSILTNSTVSGNSVSGYDASGGGISVSKFGDSFGTINTANSILSDNSSVSDTTDDLSGTIAISNGRNLFGSDVEGSAQNDLENVPASLLFAGGLADNGGPTPTLALRDAADNPALGRADPDTAPPIDQRGMARPAPAGTNPDIGAFELEQTQAAPSAIRGTNHRDVLRGTDGADIVLGLAGDDRLAGGGGDDLMKGGAGDDLLIGGAGIDRLRGGGGADRFALRHLADAPVGGPADDEVLGFSRRQHDHIDVACLDAKLGAEGNQAFRLIGRHEFSSAGQLRYEAADGGGFLVEGNVDRDLHADFAIVVNTDINGLKASDFLL